MSTTTSTSTTASSGSDLDPAVTQYLRQLRAADRQYLRALQTAVARREITPGEHYRACRDLVVMTLARDGLSERLIAYALDLSRPNVQRIKRRFGHRSIRARISHA